MKRNKRMARNRRVAATDMKSTVVAPTALRSFQIGIANDQRTQPVNVSALRQICATLLKEMLKIENGEIGIHLLAAPKMTWLNETFLQHKGSTDVITFDYSNNPPPEATMCGEIFVCVDDAVLQARRFRTNWQSEVVRYIIHGILHLLGHDDHCAAARRTMKREENRLLRSLGARFPLSRLGHKSKLRP